MFSPSSRKPINTTCGASDCTRAFYSVLRFATISSLLVYFRMDSRLEKARSRKISKSLETPSGTGSTKVKGPKRYRDVLEVALQALKLQNRSSDDVADIWKFEISTWWALVRTESGHQVVHHWPTAVFSPVPWFFCRVTTRAIHDRRRAQMLRVQVLRVKIGWSKRGIEIARPIKTVYRVLFE